MPQSLSADEERDLIANIPQQPEAFRQLYRHYFPRVYAYVASRVGREQDAEDVVADVFVKIVEAIERFEYRGAGSFAAWIFRIAYNEVQQFYRTQQRQPLIRLDELPELPSRALRPDEMLLQKEQFTRLRAMLQTLSPRRQEIISLRFFAELRNQEIAAVLGLTEKTVASHLSRGLDDLQQKYQAKDVLV